MLRFENHRRIEGAAWKDDTVWALPWLEASFFGGSEVQQLAVILAEWNLDPASAFTMACGIA